MLSISVSNTLSEITFLPFMFCVLCFRLEKEHSNVRKQLTNEVENKKSTIGSLSKELEVHQKNFIELKDELSKVGAVKE